jgi:transposase
VALRYLPPTGRTSHLTPAIRERLRQEFETADRTWTAQQVADWIAAQFGVSVSTSRLHRFLRRWKLSYQRTARNVKHKQKPEEVAAKKADLAVQEKKGSRA